MALLDRLFRRTDDRAPLLPLYRSVVERAREPHWYVEGGVADTLDGRFDMIAAVLSIVLIRLERDDALRETALLTELFVADMDGQLRQIGVGEFSVGKHVGRMVGALGGRLSAYRGGLAGGDLEGALVRNLYRGAVSAPEALAHVAGALRTMNSALGERSVPELLQQGLPR